MAVKKKQSTLSRVSNYLKPTSFRKGMLLFAIAFAVLGGGALVVSHAATPGCINYTYKQGSSGHCVKDIQTLANFKLAVSPKLATDGSFGPATRYGVTQVQYAAGLTIDGVVGPNTWKTLCSDWSAIGRGGSFLGVYKTAYLDAGCSAIVPGQ